MTVNHITRNLIFGALGQDGSYLAEQLAAEGNQVIGVIRNSSVIPKAYLHESINYVRGDILNSKFISSLMDEFRPTHVYNLASASSVAESYAEPQLSLQVNLEFVRELIENIENYRAVSGRDAFLFQASSSEMFGPDHKNLITEDTSHDPRSPYAEHKSLAHNLCVEARSSLGMKIATGILFNHESPRRPLKFVSRKITNGAYLISQGIEKKLVLGNINVQRDWGYAPDFARAINLIGKNQFSEDFVIATGHLHSLHEMCKVAFNAVGIENPFNFIESNNVFYRINENSGLIGDYSKIREKLGWNPSTTFEEMIIRMVSEEK